MEDNIPGGCQRAEAVVDSEMVELEVEATEVDECAGGGGEPLTAAVCHFSAARAGEWFRMEKNCSSTAESDGASVAAGASAAGLGLFTTTAAVVLIVCFHRRRGDHRACSNAGRRHHGRDSRHRGSRSCHRDRGTT